MTRVNKPVIPLLLQLNPLEERKGALGWLQVTLCEAGSQSPPSSNCKFWPCSLVPTFL